MPMRFLKFIWVSAVGFLLAAMILPSLAAPPAASPAAEIQSLRPPILLTNAIDRQGVDLSGVWTYSKDRHKVSFAEMNGFPPDPRNQRFRDINVQAEELAKPNLFFEFDMQRGPRATLPGAWNTPNTEMRYYDGLVWYQRTFIAEELAGRRAFLRFEAANYSTVAYLNGREVGRHEGGFTPFTFEVTEQIRIGENQITVGVDSTHRDESIPPKLTDWDIYGGITRPIRLVYTPSTFIDDQFIRLNSDNTISASVVLNGKKAANQPVTISIAALDLRLQANTDATGEVTMTFPAPARLKRWSPEAPQLYDVEIKTADDRSRDRIGFRTIRVDGENILLNEKPIFLRGISIHEEEFGTSPARIITPQAARALLAEVKFGLGGNYVRLSHYPHSEVTVRLADEMGLLVWSEIPVYWSVDFKSPNALLTARKMMAENILRDRNRASIIVWSVGNETPDGPSRLAFHRTLVADTRAWDPSRLVSAALWAEKKMINGRLVATIKDPLADQLDFLAVNNYTGWYGDNTLAEVAAMQWNNPHKKPLVFSEFGADAKFGYHDAKNMAKFSEEFQAEFYRSTLSMANKIPFLRGVSPWILKDFQSPRREHPVYQEGWNRKGIVSERGERKLAFQVLADYFNAQKEQGAVSSGKKR
jgi:beta-glucuronidase